MTNMCSLRRSARHLATLALAGVASGCATIPIAELDQETTKRVLLYAPPAKGGYVASVGLGDIYTIVHGQAYTSLSSGGQFLTIVVNEVSNSGNRATASAAAGFDGLVRRRGYPQTVEQRLTSTLRKAMENRGVQVTLVNATQGNGLPIVNSQYLHESGAAKLVVTLNGAPATAFDSIVTVHTGYGFQQLHFGYDFHTKIAAVLDTFDPKTLKQKGRMTSYYYKINPFATTSLQDTSCTEGRSYPTYKILTENIDAAHGVLLKCSEAIAEDLATRLITKKK